MSEDYRELIHAGVYRVLLDTVNMDKILAKQNDFVLPVRTGNERKYFEYALSVQTKLLRKEYADYIRSITPILVDLFELVLEKQFRISIDEYCTQGKGKKWSEEKLNNTEKGREILTVLKAAYDNSKTGFRYGFVLSDNLQWLIIHYSRDEKLNRIVRELRTVEDRIRNMAAHTIVSVTEEKITQETGFSANHIMNNIKQLFLYTGIAIKSEYWDSYDKLNRVILEKMKQK